jgi:hypothetical protein
MSILPQATDFMMLNMPLMLGGDHQKPAQYDSSQVAGGDRNRPLTVKGEEEEEEDEY